MLFQEHQGVWKPVDYAALPLTDAEKRYALIEKECPGLVVGCDKFHCYISGFPKVILETMNPVFQSL